MIWSRDLGEKKSDLIDGLSQLRVDEDSLARISNAAVEGAVPERILQDTRRKVEADRIAVSRAVRTLQSWRISKEEIDQVRAEAERLVAREDGQSRGAGRAMGETRSAGAAGRHRDRAQRDPRRAGQHRQRPVQDRRPFAAGSAGPRLRGRPAHVGPPARQPAGVVGDRRLRRRRRHADRPFRPRGLRSSIPTSTRLW